MPFILRMVMEPEKPDIEIGTVSFKSQLDEVIKNFVQVWPIYDLPFEIYTEEDERRDRAKEEEEKRKAEGGGGRESTGSKDASIDLLLAPQVAALGVINEEQTSKIGTDFDGIDGVEVRTTTENHVDRRTKRVDDVDDTTTLLTTSTTPRVCFEGQLNDEPTGDEPEVDIVVYLPLKNDGVWLDQWSDLDEDSDFGEVYDDDDVTATGDGGERAEALPLKKMTDSRARRSPPPPPSYAESGNTDFVESAPAKADDGGKLRRSLVLHRQ